MQSPKITVLGAGSFFFGRPAIWNTVMKESLKAGTLALVDTKPEVVEVMKSLADRAAKAAGARCRILASTDRREVMGDSDFIITTFSDRNAFFRGMDTELAARYGVRMCSSDTIGPGGIFRALREIPTLLSMARDAEELAPYAWMINFVNPTTVLGIALMRYSSIRSFAICDGHHEPFHRLRLLKSVGILDEKATDIPTAVEQKLDYRCAGVNHFTWVLKFDFDGKDYMPVLRENIERQAADEQRLLDTESSHANTHSKAKYNAAYSLKLWDLFGAYPDTIGHTKEYVPFFQGWGVTPVDPEPILLFDAAERQRAMDKHWQETTEYSSGKKPISEFLETGKADHATDIIDSMWGGLRKSFYINTANRGAVTNMPDDAFLELRCDVDMHGPRPQPVGEMPIGLRAQQFGVLDTHELTARAAVECDRTLLLRALCSDPIVNNIGDAERIMNELLTAQRDVLPAKWFET